MAKQKELINHTSSEMIKEPFLDYSDDDENKRDSKVTELRRRVMIITAIKFSVKNIIFDRSLMAISIVSALISIIFGVIIGTFRGNDRMEQISQMFNYFFIVVYVVLYFIFIMRMCQYFFHYKMEDKTIYIVLAHQISRTVLLFSFWIVIFLYSLLTILLDAGAIILSFAIFSKSFDGYFISLVLIFMIYSIVFSMFLISFFTFVFLCVNKQISVLICTFLLSLNFIANLPQQFIQEQEKNGVLVFNNGAGYTIQDVYNSFILEQKIRDKQMKYNMLATSINEYFLEKHFKQEGFIDKLDDRRAFWSGDNSISSVGINLYMDNPQEFILKDVPLAKTPSAWTGDWKWTGINQYKIDMHIEIEKTFVNESDIKQLIENPNTREADRKFYTEFLEFTDFLIAENGGMDQFMRKFYNDFSVYFELAKPIGSILSTKSYIATKGTEQSPITDGPDISKESSDLTDDEKARTKTISNNDIASIYKNYFTGNGLDGIGLKTNSRSLRNNINKTSSNVPTTRDLPIKTVDNFITESLFNPYMYSAVILDNYFIAYTNKYLTATTVSVAEDDINWKKYIKRRNLFGASLKANLLASSLGLFSKYTEKRYNDYWFDPKSENKIDFTATNNLFLPNRTFTLVTEGEEKIISAVTFDKESPIYVTIGIQTIILLFMMSASWLVFNRKNLQ